MAKDSDLACQISAEPVPVARAILLSLSGGAILMLAFSVTPALLYPQPGYVKWNIYSQKIEHPFAPLIGDSSSSHPEKLNFRMCVPLLLHPLRPGERGFLVFNILVTGVMLAAIGSALREYGLHTMFSGIAILSGLRLSTYGLAPSASYFDATALALLALSCAVSRPFWLALVVFLGSWTDERAFIASGLIFVWHYRAAFRTGETGLARVWNSPQSRAIISAWAAYLATRMLLAYSVSMPTGTRDIGFPGVLGENFLYLPLAYWGVFEFAWLIIAIYLWELADCARLTLCLFLAALIPVLSVALVVYDLSRSLAYAFPALLIALRETGMQTRNKRMIVAVAILTLLMPNYEIIGPDSIWLMKSIPLTLFEIIIS